jgi:ankyrin repeat protein
LAQAYGETITRIRSQRKGFRLLAERVLSLLTCAERLLKGSELEEALAVRAGTPTLDRDKRENTRIIVSVCAGLVTVDEDSCIIRLVHDTTRAYLATHMFCIKPREDFTTLEDPMTFNAQKNDDAMADTQKTFAIICITYLSFTAFQDGVCQTDDEFEERLRSYPLYGYAAQNWGHHAREAITLYQEVMDFLPYEANVEAASQALMASQHHKADSGYSQRVSKNMTGVHLAAYYGLTETIAALLEKGHDPNAKDVYGRTPLWFAAANGHQAAAKLLLKKGDIDPDSHDTQFRRTPLSYAAEKGHDAVVKLLLAREGIRIDSKDSKRRMPLSYAVQNGHETTVKLLLRAGGRPEKTMLRRAARNGHEAIVLLLLESGVNIDANADGYKQTALHLAARNGHEAVVRLLIENKAITTAKDKIGATALHWAVWQGHKSVVSYLLPTANIDMKDRLGGTPLAWAIEHVGDGSKVIIDLLLKNGAVAHYHYRPANPDIDLSNFVGENHMYEGLLATHREFERRKEVKKPFGASFRFGTQRQLNHPHHEVRLSPLHRETGLSPLRETGLSPLPDEAERERMRLKGERKITTPLLRAATIGNEAAVRMMLERTDVDSKDTVCSRTPLSWAARYGHEAAVKLLLDIDKVDVNSKDKDSQTPLSYAARNGHNVIVKLLLDTNKVDVNSEDRDSRTPLSWAARYGHGAVVKLLLDTGKADVTSKDKDSRTPLSWAAEYGHKVVVKLLLDTSKVDVDSKDATYGQTPLSYAAKNGRNVIVKLLLDTNMVDVNSKDKNTRTPLSWAAMYKHEAVVKLLLDTGRVDVDSKDTAYGQTPLS